MPFMYKNYMDFYRKKNQSRFFSQILKNEVFFIERFGTFGSLRGNNFLKFKKKMNFKSFFSHKFSKNEFFIEYFGAFGSLRGNNFFQKF